MYDEWFYEQVRDGARRSADVVAPMLAEILEPRSVVDVGCGEGWWANAFAEQGCEVLGIDDAAKPPAGSALTAETWMQHDLTKPLPFTVGRYDVAVCLEVGEHLPARYADQLVDDLTRIAPTVIWSAAIPGQGGHHHVNEQWPEYWTSRFQTRGMAYSPVPRAWIWDDPRVEPWYKQNLIIFSREPDRHPAVFGSAHMAPLTIVHPMLWSHRVGVPTP